MYGISTYSRKRTMLPYADIPPDLTVGEDHILFLDLGPVFETSEADFSRTFVLGDDPLEHRMQKTAAQAFTEGKRHF